MFGSPKKKAEAKVKVILKKLVLHWGVMNSRWKFVTVDPIVGGGEWVLTKHTDQPKWNPTTLFWESTGKRAGVEPRDFDNMDWSIRDITREYPAVHAMPECCIARPSDIPGVEGEEKDEGNKSPLEMLREAIGGGCPQRQKEETREIASHGKAILLALIQRGEPITDDLSAKALKLAKDFVTACEAKPAE